MMNKFKISPHLIINGYEFQREIGRGQFSVVWEAIHLLSKNQVAIKCISNDEENAKLKTTIFKEIFINQKIFHPFICQYLDFFESNSTFFLVFENCVENLVTFSNKRGFLDEKTAHKIFCELLYAVESLHNDYLVIHRDLKVENVLIDSNKNVRLSDFGLSVSIKSSFSRSPRRNITNTETIMNQQVGSIYYMSPEMAKNEEYDKSIDIWSLGVILFAITNGKLPFDGNSVDSVKQKILFSQPQFQSHFNSYSPNLKTLIIRMLDKNKKSRITIDEIKKNSWFVERKYSKIEEIQKMSFDLTQIQIDRQIIEKYCLNDTNKCNEIIQSIKKEIDYCALIRKNEFSSIDQIELNHAIQESSQNIENKNETSKNETSKNETSKSETSKNEKSKNEKSKNDAENSNSNKNNSFVNENLNQNQNINSNESNDNNRNENENLSVNSNGNNENSNFENVSHKKLNSDEKINCNSDFNRKIQSSNEIEYEKFGIKPRSIEFVTYLIQLREKIKQQMKIEEKDIITAKIAVVSSPRCCGKRRMSQPPKSTAPLAQTMKPNVKKPIVPTKKLGALSKSKKQPLSLTIKTKK